MGEKRVQEETQEALRVSQLDASELDTELFELLRAQIDNAFKYLKPAFLVKFGAEVNAVLRLVLWKFSVDAVESTIGQQLLELRYQNEATRGQHVQWMSRRQKVLFAVLTVGGPWLEERLDDFSTATREYQYSEKIWKVVERVAGYWKVASLVNFLVFLMQGRYRFLFERLLRVHPVFPHPQGVRQVGFEYMDRELLWHGFAEFLFFVLPLVNFRKAKNFLFRQLIPTSGTKSSLDRGETDYEECVVCGEWPYNPQEIGCKHVFCYYCVKSNFLADQSYSCPICGQRVDTVSSIRPVTVQQTDGSTEEDEDEDKGDEVEVV